MEIIYMLRRTAEITRSEGRPTVIGLAILSGDGEAVDAQSLGESAAERGKHKDKRPETG